MRQDWRVNHPKTSSSSSEHSVYLDLHVTEAPDQHQIVHRGGPLHDNTLTRCSIFRALWPGFRATPPAFSCHDNLYRCDYPNQFQSCEPVMPRQRRITSGSTAPDVRSKLRLDYGAHAHACDRGGPSLAAAAWSRLEARTPGQGGPRRQGEPAPPGAGGHELSGPRADRQGPAMRGAG